MSAALPPESIRSNAHAEATLADAPYVAYCLVQAMKLFISLTVKRWPQLR